MKSVFLILPFILSLAVPFYNRLEPSLFGFPFFWWWLLLMPPAASVFMWLASRADG